MNRLGFLKRMALPVAVAGAAAVASKLDPDGEPMREVDGQLVVNGDNVIVQHVSFKTGPTKAAIHINSGARHTAIIGVDVEMVGQ